MANINKQPIIKLGNNFAVLLTGSGHVYTWGCNKRGQLGLGCENTKLNTPVKVDFENEPIKMISVGHNFAAAVSVNNIIYTWGANNYDRLGYPQVLNQTSPRKKDFLDGQIMDIQCVSTRVYVLLDNRVYYWGRKIGTEYNMINRPYVEYSDSDEDFIEDFIEDLAEEKTEPNIIYEMIQFPDDIPIKKFFCGDNHCFAIDINDIPYSWGSNTYGQLANGNSLHSIKPIYAEELDGYTIKNIICRDHFTIILYDSGYLYHCGERIDNFLGCTFGQLVRIKFFKKNVKNVYCDKNNLFIIDKYGKIYSKIYAEDKTNIYYHRANFFKENGAKNIYIPSSAKISYAAHNKDCIFGVTETNEIFTWGLDKHDLNLVNTSSKPKLPIKVTYFSDNYIQLSGICNIKSARKI